MTQERRCLFLFKNIQAWTDVTKKETDQLLTLLLPLALLVMLESLLATISTSFADITKHVELSSPERQLKKQKKKNKEGEKIRQDSEEQNT